MPSKLVRFEGMLTWDEGELVPGLPGHELPSVPGRPSNPIAETPGTKPVLPPPAQPKS